MCGCIGNCILARAPIRPNSAWKALGVIGPSRSVMKTCEDSPCSRCRRRRARISSPCSPCARVAGRWPVQSATIADRTTRTPASRGDSRSGSWLRPDGRGGWTSWRPPSTARSRPSSVVGADRPSLRFSTIFWLRFGPTQPSSHATSDESSMPSSSPSARNTM